LASVSILHRKTSIHGAEAPDRSVADRTVGEGGFFPCDDTGSESVNRRRVTLCFGGEGDVLRVTGGLSTDPFPFSGFAAPPIKLACHLEFPGETPA